VAGGQEYVILYIECQSTGPATLAGKSGTRVPPAIQKSLDFNGLSSKEIRLSSLIEFLRSKGEADLVRTFEADLPLSDVASKSKASNRVAKRIAAQLPATSGALALFALVKELWLQEAFAYFESGNKELRFSANSPHLGPALELKIDNVYFKVSGRNEVIARAQFLSLETEDPDRSRLPGYDERSELWKARFYYGFCDLSWTKSPIPVTSLCRYPSGKLLRNDVPGACVIYDIAAE
jgi:hypothetical protein